MSRRRTRQLTGGSLMPESASNEKHEHDSTSVLSKQKPVDPKLVSTSDGKPSENVRNPDEKPQNQANSQIVLPSVPKLSLKRKSDANSSEFMISYTKNKSKKKTVRTSEDNVKLVYNRQNESSSNISESDDSSSAIDEIGKLKERDASDDLIDELENDDEDDATGSSSMAESNDESVANMTKNDNQQDNELVEMNRTTDPSNTSPNQISKKAQMNNLDPSDPTKPKRGRKPSKLKLDGEANEIEPAKKSKTPRSITSYYLFIQEQQPKVAEKNPNLKLRAQRRVVAEMWSKLTDNERLMWRQKAMKLQKKGSKGMISTGAASTQYQYVSKKALDTLNATDVDKSHISQPTNTPAVPDHLKHFADDCTPFDLAAHLALLGESITTIGTRLREHEGKFAVQGASIVLMDSFLCSLVPLFCLTTQIEEMNGCPKDVLLRILDNVSYIMPAI